VDKSFKSTKIACVRTSTLDSLLTQPSKAQLARYVVVALGKTVGAPGFQLVVAEGIEQLAFKVTSVFGHTSTLLAVSAEVGVGFTVIKLVVALHPAAVKVKLTVPADTPVTRPLLVIVALVGLLLSQVPPELGDSVMVFPKQNDDDGILTAGVALIVIVAFPV
jgi:hypothetical protein